MSAEEKAQEDIKKLNDRSARLQAEIAQRDLISDGHSIPSQYHVPSNMMGRLVGKSNEETETNMKEFTDNFTRDVQGRVDDCLASTGQPQNAPSITVDESKKLSDLSLAEQTKFYHKNLALYNQLANR